MTPDLSDDYERDNRRAKIINGMEKKKWHPNDTINGWVVPRM